MTTAYEARITDKKRAQVCAAWQSGARQRDIAQQFGIAQSSVSKIVAGIPRKKREPLLVRTCVDCGTPLKYKTRCSDCNQKWRVAYNQDYTLRLKLRRQEGKQQ